MLSLTRKLHLSSRLYSQVNLDFQRPHTVFALGKLQVHKLIQTKVVNNRQVKTNIHRYSLGGVSETCFHLLKYSSQPPIVTINLAS